MSDDSLRDRQNRPHKNAMTVDHAQALIAPHNVALIGVSNDPKKLTARPLQFCKQHKFSGNIYLVNPLRKQVQGQTAFPTVSSIPEKVDHAYILLNSNRLTRVEFFSPSNLREDAEETVKALYGVTDVRQLRRIWS